MKATIFGASYTKPETYEETVLIGKLLTEQGYQIKSGGYFGLMEAISKGATTNGGHATGYTCKTFPSTKGNQFLTDTVVSDDVYDRLRCLISDTDLFVVLNGGLGTLSELFLTLDVIRKMKDPPTVLLIGRVWTLVMMSMGLLVNDEELRLFTIVEDYRQILNTLQTIEWKKEDKLLKLSK